MKSLIVKRSVTVGGHRTSITLEDAFWDALRMIADARNLSLAALLSEINHGRQATNLSSHIRLFVLEHFRSQKDEPVQQQPTLRPEASLHAFAR
jgi:predicted DNA-binding ribbon-helix-helix protein